MNDKKIREIRISYLKAQNSEIRIYQEKSIGNSVCDIMAVTDLLTGYEIKSDDDNYSRLQSQISAYNRFFDRNYIVVGGSHRNSIENKVPDNWGIIIIEQDRVSICRPAKNGYPNTSAQLGILWKLELKNILTKCDLPLYTYKPKDYIITEIISNIDESIIHKCLIYELMHRDYSFFDAKDYSIYSVSDDTSSVFENIPASDIVDTLSEQNLNDLTLDKWISLYRQAKELRQNKETRFIEDVSKRTPHKIPYTDIEVSPGAPWISKKIINEFICYLCYGKESNLLRNNQWEIIFKKMYPTAKILSVEPSFFKPKMRQKVLSQIKNGDYDGIIIAYSCFERIPLSVDCVTSQMESRLEKIQEAMRRGANFGSYTALKRECEYIKKQASELINDLNSAPEEITFDDLEINTLFVDEAHNFKNIEIRTKLKNLKGINTKAQKSARKCFVRCAMFRKTTTAEVLFLQPAHPFVIPFPMPTQCSYIYKAKR